MGHLSNPIFLFKLLLKFFPILPIPGVLVVWSSPRLLVDHASFAQHVLCMPIQWSYTPPKPQGGDESVDSSCTHSHNMSYATAQSKFYLVVGTWWIQLLGDVKVTHAGCDVHEAGLRRQVSELGNDIQGLDQKCSLLAAEKATAEEVRVVL